MAMDWEIYLEVDMTRGVMKSDNAYFISKMASYCECLVKKNDEDTFMYRKDFYACRGCLMVIDSQEFMF